MGASLGRAREGTHRRLFMQRAASAIELGSDPFILRSRPPRAHSRASDRELKFFARGGVKRGDLKAYYRYLGDQSRGMLHVMISGFGKFIKTI